MSRAGDAGNCTFWMTPEDLARRDFSKVQGTIIAAWRPADSWDSWAIPLAPEPGAHRRGAAEQISSTRSMVSKRHPAGGFLNVDLEVYSRHPLDLFATALGATVEVLFLGKQRTRHLAALELAGSGWQQTPDPIIMRLVNLIRGLPEPARTVWNHASERRFDIGCEASRGPEALALALKPSTIAAIAEVNGTIAITIYPGGEAHPNGKKRRVKTRVTSPPPDAR